jgi:hypothetical protein
MGQRASSTLASYLYLSTMPDHRSSKKDPEVADDESVEAVEEEAVEEEAVEEEAVEEEAVEEEAVEEPQKKSTKNKKKMSSVENEEQVEQKEMTEEEKTAAADKAAAAKKAAIEKAADEKKAQLAEAVESITKAGVPHKVSSVISAVWLDDTKTYVTAALLGRPIETSIKSVNRLKNVPDEKRIERLASLYSRVAGLEEKLIRARLDVVHIEHARIAMAYPDTTMRKRKLPTGFIAGETTKPARVDDDDCGCNDAELEEEDDQEVEEEVPQKKRKTEVAKKPKAVGEPRKKKKVAKCEDEDA